MATYYECCKNREAKQCVCINCGKIYHQSCIERRKSVVVIDATRAKCCSFGSDIGSVVEAGLRKEIDLLNKLLEEMEKWNKLLEEKIEHLESKPHDLELQTKSFSYARVLAGRKVTPLVIKPKTQTENGAIFKKIKSYVDLEKLKISIDTLKETKDGTLIIKCNNEVNNEMLKKEIGKIENLNCEIDSLKLKNPRMKIVNVVDEVSSEQKILELIIQQNIPDHPVEDIKILYIYTNKTKNTKTV